MIIADSDVLIDALRGREPFANRIAEAIRANTLATTAISVFELLSGAKSDHEMDKVVRLLAPLEIFTVDAEASTAAAETRRSLDDKPSRAPSS